MSLALDTDVLVRLLTRDDEAQCAAAVRLVLAAAQAQAPVLISTGVILETVWVLRSRYGRSVSEIHQAIIAILETQEFVVQETHVLEEALMRWRDFPDADFADCVHAAWAVQEHGTLATFDPIVARLPGAELVPR